MRNAMHYACSPPLNHPTILTYAECTFLYFFHLYIDQTAAWMSKCSYWLNWFTLCLYMVAKPSAAFMAFPWPIPGARTHKWKVIKEFRFGKSPELSPHLGRCTGLRGKEAIATNKSDSVSWSSGSQVVVLVFTVLFLWIWCVNNCSVLI